ncbi:MAG: hypothetical protein IT365_00865 [Candidatus Hydrogenedentes bacterium]|nr:hypothetical protein [Candidatus Hydrogenedentota bacterium]
MRHAFRSMILVCVGATVMMGCGYIWLPSERALLDDAKVVAPYLPESPGGSVAFDVGEFQGGTAVLGANDTAFWVKDGIPYTVSEAARSAAPNMKQAPESIQYNDAFALAAQSGQ